MAFALFFPAFSLPTVAGPRTPDQKFTLDWDNATRQLRNVSARDARGMFPFAPARYCLGEIVISDGRHTWTSARAKPQAPPEVTTDRNVERIAFSLQLAPDAGTPSPWYVKQVFYRDPEGAVFCDFTILLPENSRPAVVTKCALRFRVNSGRFGNFRWFWKRDWRGGLYLDRGARLVEKGYVRVFGASVARQPPGYTNHIEFFLERKQAFASRSIDEMAARVSAEKGGVKEFEWTLYNGGPIRVKPGYSYNNCWGIAVASARTNDLALGQRIVHWQEGNAGLMTFPSDSAIQAMADCGATLCILHLYWKTPGWGRDFTAYDPVEMARWVSTCHGYGIRCLLYTIPIDKPGIDGINHEGYDRYHCDGLYFDFGSVHFRGTHTRSAMAYYPDRDFPAMDYLDLTRHYRDVVGPEGIMIAHAGGGAPDALFCLNMNAYLGGEAGEQRAIVGDTFDAAWYHSGAQYAVSHVWCEYKPFQTTRAAANFAALGAFPHVLCGRGTHQDDNYSRSLFRPARFTLPYWQMLRCIPMDRETTMYSEATGAAAACNLPKAHCVVYRRAPDQMLVIVSNLGESGRGTITLDTDRLLPAKPLNVFRIKGRDIATLRIEELGSLRVNRLETGSLAPHETEAFLLVGPEKLGESKRRFAEIRRLVGMFNDRTAPGAVTDLAAKPEAGGVRLTWSAATDNSHIVEYRIMRRCENGLRQDIAVVEEATTFLDATAPPAERLRYEVIAVDVSGNRGTADRVEIATPKPERVALAVPAVNRMKPYSGHWRMEKDWFVQSTPRSPASEKGALHSIGPVHARFVRVYFTGGVKNFGCAHVVEMEARDVRGRNIKPVDVLTSGSDPGHPATDVMDGNTQKNGNGWWSDRHKGLPAWVGLDFGVSVAIDRVWILTYWDGVRYYEYSVQISEDGQEWRSVAETERAVPLARAFCDVRFENGEIGVTTLDPPPLRTGGGILFRCHDENNGYAFYLDNSWDGAVCLAKLQSGKLKKIKALFFPYSNFNPIPHRLRVRVNGSIITCYCDTVKVFEVDDNTFSSGAIGVFSLTGAALRFNNLFTGDP